VLPIVVRELSVVARRRETYRIRVTAGVVAMLATSWLFIVSGAGISTAQQSQMVFRALSGFCFLYALFVGVLTTSDQISGEKREGTLGLLFLTDLSGHDVVLGKLVSSARAALTTRAAISDIPPNAWRPL
jgi:ABC-type transport system involved in cytochrome c biogenesis permease component